MTNDDHARAKLAADTAAATLLRTLRAAVEEQIRSDA
jgi:hypothetical protein